MSESIKTNEDRMKDYRNKYKEIEDEIKDNPWIALACQNSFIIYSMTFNPLLRELFLKIGINETIIDYVYVIICDEDQSLNIQFPYAVSFTLEIENALKMFIYRSIGENPWISQAMNEYLAWDLDFYIYVNRDNKLSDKEYREINLVENV